MLGHLNEGLLELIVLGLRAYDCGGTLSYGWNKKEKRFLPKSPRAMRIVHLKAFLLNLSFISHTIQIILTAEAIPIRTLCQCFFYLIFLVAGCFAIYFHAVHSHEIAAFLNGMLLFELNQKKDKGIVRRSNGNNLLDKCGMLLAKSLIPTAVVLPLLSSWKVYKHPCSPRVLGFFLVDECRQNGTFFPLHSILRDVILPWPSKITLLMVFAMKLFTALNTLCQIHCILCVSLILKPLILNMYIKILNVATYNTGNGTENSENSNFEQNLSNFQQLKILLQSYNCIYKQTVLLMGSVYNVLMATLCLYIFINLGKHLPFELRIIYFYGATFCGLFCLLTFGQMSVTNSESSNIIRNLKLRQPNIIRQQFYHKRLRSLSAMKVKIGESNVVKESTPIELQDFILQRTVDLTLLT